MASVIRIVVVPVAFIFAPVFAQAEEVRTRQFAVSGAARLIAVDNGDHWSDELFAGNSKPLHNGFAMAILRSGQTGGTVQLDVTGAGLKAASQSFTVK